MWYDLVNFLPDLHLLQPQSFQPASTLAYKIVPPLTVQYNMTQRTNICEECLKYDTASDLFMPKVSVTMKNGYNTDYKYCILDNAFPSWAYQPFQDDRCHSVHSDSTVSPMY